MDQTLKDALTQVFGSKAVWLLTQLGVGVGLMYVIKKFFKEVEEGLNGETKLEIATWLKGVKTAQTVQSWPETFYKIFVRVFGRKAFSWRCFFSSCLATLAASLICTVCLVGYFNFLRPLEEGGAVTAVLLAMMNGLELCVFDYLALLQTRHILGLMRRSSSVPSLLLLLALNIVTGGLTGAIPAYLTALGPTLHPFQEYTRQQTGVDRVFDQEVALFNRNLLAIPPSSPSYGYLMRNDREGFRRDDRQFQGFRFLTLWLPGFFTTIWLWLYVEAGFLLKFARRFDRSLGWFNCHFDIEKRPLSSIGLVSGALVALVYWAAVIVSRVV